MPESFEPRFGPLSANVHPAAATPVRRLWLFVLGVLGIVAGLEILVRCNEPLFEAATHRALAKAAMFDRHPRVDFLLFGTSRTQDGVSPDLISRSLRQIGKAPVDFRGYNAAFTSSSIEALEDQADRFIARPELKWVVFELSDPQIANLPTPWNPPPAATGSIEADLAAILRRVRLVKHREAFVSDNIARLPALLVFGPSLGGWEVKGIDQLSTWLGRKERDAEDFDASIWKPRVFRPDEPKRALDPAMDAIANRLAAISSKYTARGIRVSFASPPLSREWSPARERDVLQPLFAEVARRSGCEVWDFASLDLPQRFFRNSSHLGNVGRAHYSRALAIEGARLLGKL